MLQETNPISLREVAQPDGVGSALVQRRVVVAAIRAIVTHSKGLGHSKKSATASVRHKRGSNVAVLLSLTGSLIMSQLTHCHVTRCIAHHFSCCTPPTHYSLVLPLHHYDDLAVTTQLLCTLHIHL